MEKAEEVVVEDLIEDSPRDKKVVEVDKELFRKQQKKIFEDEKFEIGHVFTPGDIRQRGTTDWTDGTPEEVDWLGAKKQIDARGRCGVVSFSTTRVEEARLLDARRGRYSP